MYKIDKIDLEIVNLLMANGRMPCTEMAERIGNITERAVRYRLDRLIEERIIEISAIAHPGKLGYSVVADVFIEVETSLIEEVARRLADISYITYVACSIGANDISVQLVGRSNEELYSFVTEVIGRIPGVRKTTTSIVPVTLKDVYQWHIPPDVINHNSK